MSRLPRASRSRTWAAVGATVLGAALLSSCSTGSTATDEGSQPESTTSVDADAFPVTIEHAFGETTIEEEPTRVATLGWNDHDTALALGVTVVGATKLTWGGNEAGSSDWFDAELEEAGTEAPVRYDDADGAPVVEIAKLDPDLILATNSGITEAEYKKLSKIAPVVAYPDAPWITPWQTSLEMVGEALGRSTLAEEVGAETEAEIEAAKEEYPAARGQVADLLLPHHRGPLHGRDLRPGGPARLLHARPRAWSTRRWSPTRSRTAQFYGTVSAERSADLESDVLITYAETEDEMADLREGPADRPDPGDQGRRRVRPGRQARRARRSPTPRRCRSPTRSRTSSPTSPGPSTAADELSSAPRPRLATAGRTRTATAVTVLVAAAAVASVRSVLVGLPDDLARRGHRRLRPRPRDRDGPHRPHRVAWRSAPRSGWPGPPCRASPATPSPTPASSASTPARPSPWCWRSGLRRPRSRPTSGSPSPAPRSPWCLVHAIAASAATGHADEAGLAGAALTAGLSSWTSGVLLTDRQTLETFRYWQVGTVGGRGMDVPDRSAVPARRRPPRPDRRPAAQRARPR